MADTKDQKQQTEADTGSVTTHSSHGSIHCITIIGTIEGHQEAPEATKTTKYEHVLPQLAAIEETPDIDGLLILLNTAGGDVEAGLAIAELIAGMHKPTISLGARRRAFHWHSACRRGTAHTDCAVCLHDAAPCSYQRDSHRRAANL